jgi:REP element-mobilizing transposase RayT
LPNVGAHSVSLLLLHIVWSTRGRHPILGPELDKPLKRVLRGKAWEIGAALHAFGAARDHVHVLVRVLRAMRLAGSSWSDGNGATGSNR